MGADPQAGTSDALVRVHFQSLSVNEGPSSACHIGACLSKQKMSLCMSELPNFCSLCRSFLGRPARKGF